MEAAGLVMVDAVAATVVTATEDCITTGSCFKGVCIWFGICTYVVSIRELTLELDFSGDRLLACAESGNYRKKR